MSTAPEPTVDVTKDIPIVDGAPKGRNQSGRSWKVRPQKRASTLVTKVKLNNLSRTWDEKQDAKRARKMAKEKEIDQVSDSS